MSMQRWEPMSELTPLREAINRLFEDSFVGLERFDLFGRTFPVDVRDLAGEYVIEASLPGIKPEDLKVTATGDTLTIEAARKTETKDEKSGAYVRHERYEGELRRSITLPAGMRPEDVTAEYEHGVLTLHVPKAEQIKPKTIAVEVKKGTAR
jgi:HSP20 family protein